MFIPFIIAEHYLFATLIGFATQFMGRIQQVASFQVEGEIFVQPGLRDEVECDKSPFHDVLISLRSNRINLIAHIIKNQRIDKTAFVSGEMVRKVEVGNPRAAPSNCEPVVTVAKGIFALV